AVFSKIMFCSPAACCRRPMWCRPRSRKRHCSKFGISTGRCLPTWVQKAHRKLADFIADNCYVVIVVGHDIDKAHQMFVVLNERGKKLQRNDILKADILSRMTAGDSAWAAAMWDDMNLALGEGFEPFFAHLRVIYGYGRLHIVSCVRTVIRE